MTTDVPASAVIRSSHVRGRLVIGDSSVAFQPNTTWTRLGPVVHDGRPIVVVRRRLLPARLGTVVWLTGDAGRVAVLPYELGLDEICERIRLVGTEVIRAASWISLNPKA